MPRAAMATPYLNKLVLHDGGTSSCSIMHTHIKRVSESVWQGVPQSVQRKRGQTAVGVAGIVENSARGEWRAVVAAGNAVSGAIV